MRIKPNKQHSTDLDSFRGGTEAGGGRRAKQGQQYVLVETSD